MDTMETLQPKKPSRKTVNLFLTLLPEEKERLEDHAQTTGRPITWIVRDACRAYLDTVEAKGEMRPAHLNVTLSHEVPLIRRSPGRPPGAKAARGKTAKTVANVRKEAL